MYNDKVNDGFENPKPVVLFYDAAGLGNFGTAAWVYIM